MPLGISWPLRELENLSKHIGLVSDSGVVATAPTAEANRLLWLRSNDATSAAEESAAKTHQGPISGLTALEKATGVHGWNDGTDFLFAPIGLRFSKVSFTFFLHFSHLCENIRTCAYLRSSDFSARVGLLVCVLQIAKS